MTYFFPDQAEENIMKLFNVKKKNHAIILNLNF